MNAKLTGRPQKEQIIRKNMNLIHECEKRMCLDFDLASGCFGEIMAEIFAWRRDEWEKELRHMGFFLGKFIYLMDAFEDVEQDQKTGNYNVFLKEYGQAGFSQKAEKILSMMMAECARAFERLPIVENTEILRNILYSGVWCRYELVKCRREGK